MNLAKALNVALPELPVRAVAQERPPKIDPNLIVREQMRDGKLAVMVLTPKNRRYYPMTHEQWAVLQSFDGERTYCEIAEMLTAQTSVPHTEEYVREFAESIADLPCWYKTAQEQNIALWQKIAPGAIISPTLRHCYR